MRWPMACGVWPDAHHERHVGAVHIGVHQSDCVAQILQGDGEVDGDGAFADTAFARTDGNDVLTPGIGSFGCSPGA